MGLQFQCWTSLAACAGRLQHNCPRVHYNSCSEAGYSGGGGLAARELHGLVFLARLRLQEGLAGRLPALVSSFSHTCFRKGAGHKATFSDYSWPLYSQAALALLLYQWICVHALHFFWTHLSTISNSFEMHSYQRHGIAITRSLRTGFVHCKMNNDPLSPILDSLYPGARVHHGFLDQFRAVTDQAANASDNIRCITCSRMTPSSNSTICQRCNLECSPV